MALVIDTNRAGDFSAPLSGHAREILYRIKTKKITVVLGGDLYKELSSTQLVKIIIELRAAGRLFRLDDVECDTLTASLRDGGLLRSDDPHVVANVILGNASLTYTEDKLLMIDLRNRSIVPHRTKILTLRTPLRHARPMLDGC